MKMKKIVLSIIAVFCTLYGLRAQEVVEEVPVVRDSVIYHISAAVDSSLIGESILSLMPSRARGGAANINLYQSQQIKDNLSGYINKNKDRSISGYRVRIFFDNKQNSRTSSEAAVESFKKCYPGIRTYRTYQSPFFKVTVGDFRTKSEAMALLKSVKYLFPAAFIVKENINYPAADRHHTYDADTVRIVTPLL